MTTELENTKHEVQRKIGRNILVFQQMELLLKHLISNFQYSGFISELEANRSKKAKSIQTKTLGSLVSQLFENIYSPVKNASSPEDIKEVHLSFSVNIEADPEYYESRKRALASMINERNDLVHHLLSRINLDSIQSWIEAERYLDAQYEKITPEIDVLKNLISTFQEGAKAQAAFLQTEEFEKYHEVIWLQQSRLVSTLCEIASQSTQVDGWTSLSAAGQQLRKLAPGEMETISARSSHKTLLSLLLATELFDVTEETTPKGGTRKLFRLKPMYWD